MFITFYNFTTIINSSSSNIFIIANTFRYYYFISLYIIIIGQPVLGTYSTRACTMYVLRLRSKYTIGVELFWK